MANGISTPDWQHLDSVAHAAIVDLRNQGDAKAPPEVKGLALTAGMYLGQCQRERGGVFVPTKTILGACTALGAGAMTAAVGLWRGLFGNG